ncbi:Sorting nexin-29 [Tritrichomonas musculus]|uniref:Sorting nexin-29 n=1 Tax=Tritrichomonas musculus TaxID=1915356 RepID=A0ABR2KFQ3_9EUKA
MTNAKIIPLSSMPNVKQAQIQSASVVPKMYLSVESSELDKSLNCIIYIIEVGILIGQNVHIHQVHKRYSALNQFDELVRPVFNDTRNLQPFPPKKVFGNKDAEFIAHRAQALQTYILSLLRVPGMVETLTFIRFFEIDPNLLNHA